MRWFIYALLGTIGLSIYLMLLLPGLVRMNARVVWVLNSPDGQYELALYSEPPLLPKSWSVRGLPGYVELRDRSNTVIEEHAVDPISSVGEISWDQYAVHFHFVDGAAYNATWWLHP